MLYLLLLVLAMGGLALLAAYLKATGKLGFLFEPEPKATEALPDFRRCECFMSKAEREFHDVLLGIVGPQGYRLFAQVPLTRLVKLPSGLEKRQSWQNRIDRKSVDFVLCEPRMLRPVLAIELDDSSHEREDRKQRDGLVERILEKAGVPLLRRKCEARGYKREELAAAVSERLEAPPAR
jgi:very-short-patch-repair endonuclease